MCAVGPDAVFAVYSDDEGPRETAGAGYGVEEGVRVVGLGVCADRLIRGTHGIQRSLCPLTLSLMFFHHIVIYIRIIFVIKNIIINYIIRIHFIFP